MEKYKQWELAGWYIETQRIGSEKKVLLGGSETRNNGIEKGAGRLDTKIWDREKVVPHQSSDSPEDFASAPRVFDPSLESIVQSGHPPHRLATAYIAGNLCSRGEVCAS